MLRRLFRVGFAATAIVPPLAALLAASAPAAAGPALLYDANTRQVIYAEDVDHPWYPASLTKMMTAYVVFEAWKSGKANRSADVVISARANSRPKVRLGLGVGKLISYDEALAALIIHSANDIAVALAEAVSGSEAAFVEEMNATAARLGMPATRFVNANGLPGEGQHSTARDLATLTQALLDHYPQHAGLFSLMEAPVGGRTVSTHNPVLVRVPGGDGMKTGFTCSAGYNIVATATREGATLVAIVLGEQTPLKRELRTAALLEHGFRVREWKAAFPAVTLDKLPVEPFDIEATRTANLVKRYKDCQAPEPELDADGNPICPAASEIKGLVAGRAIKVIKAMRTTKGKWVPEVCIKLLAEKQKAAPETRKSGKAPGRRAAAEVPVKGAQIKAAQIKAATGKAGPVAAAPTRNDGAAVFGSAP